MLQSLHIENYVLIDSLDIDFPEGLVIITGQTGAGKSILLGAVSLLMGAKADASVISTGKESCIVEGTFRLDGRDDLRAFFEENDLQWPEDGLVYIRRVVTSTGRSRTFICDEPASVPVLQQLGSRIIDIHSQHKSLVLEDHKFQLSVLDSYAGNAGALESCAASYRRFSTLKAELEDLKDRLRKAETERDYNESRLEKLKAANLRSGELEELEAEQKQLAHAEQIRVSLAEAQAAFNPEDGAGILSTVRDASRHLSSLSEYMPSMGELSERLESARIELADIELEISSALDSVNVSDGRLEAVENRLSTLYDLLHRFSCSDIDALIAERDACAALLGDSSEMELKIDDVTREMEKERKNYDSICLELHKSRQAAAPKLAEKILGILRFLELDRAVFEVSLAPSDPSAAGTDACAFLFSSTGKTQPQDLSKCASGGELSRIMLSLKAVMAEFSAMPTLVFDEIDTGVSGSVADEMGSIICDMGRTMQVVAITHLPQVAAKGSAHFVVSKGADFVSTIRKVEGEDRVKEVARMLSGASVTPQAMDNARSLLAGN